MATIFITGGGRGIGLELTKAYLAAGHRILLGVRKPEDVRIPGLASDSILPLDVRDAASVARLREWLIGVSIDVLINNAGIIGPQRQSALDTDFDGFLETLEVNTLGPLRVTQALLGNLRAAGSAKVAVISSRMGALSRLKSDRVAYRASKAAVNKLVQCLAIDLAPEGVALAAIHPGWVRTEMGGGEADIDPATSAAGILKVIEALDVSRTGKFWNYDGEELDW